MRESWRALRLMVRISWRADRIRSLAALVTASGQTLSNPLRAIGLERLVDGVAVRDAATALSGVGLVVGFAALHRLMSWASLNVRMRLRENTQVYLDAELMALTAGIPGLEHHERPDYLDRVELLRAERESLANPFNPISWSVAALVQTAATVTLLFGVHPVLALLPLCGLPGLLLTARFERADADLRERQAEPGRRARHLFALATEAAAAKEVRIFALADELLARRRQIFEGLERERIGLAIRATSLTSGSWLLFAAGYAAAGGFAAHLAAGGAASLGGVVLVLNLGAQLDHRLADLAGYVAWLVRTNRAVRRLLWLMDHAAAERRRLAPVAPAPIPARLVEGIRFEGVSFSYPGTAATVLRDVNLLLPAGRTVAVVGDNGAGKTTLVKLLLRLYEPTSGRISVDGVDLRALPFEPWRARVSAAFQDFARLQLRAREAIGVGDVPLIPDDPALLRALERAAAADLVAALPGALETQLGRELEGGVELSLGQWQKVALGRAMMRPSPLLLVLDEPTASLDAPTEHALFERFAAAAREANAGAGAVTLLVSHRFSTVRMADLILVVAGGTIAEAGDHAALMQARGVYAQLYELQARAYR